MIKIVEAYGDFRNSGNYRNPFFAHIDLTYRCNLKCIHCCSRLPIGRELTLKKIKNVLLQLKQEGCFMLVFSGGEIFLRDDLWEILDFANTQGFALRLLTNCTLIKKNEVKALKNMRLDFIQTSLYGALDKVHDYTTKVCGSFYSTMRSIRLLNDYGINVRVIFLMMKHNFFHYEILKKMIKYKHTKLIPFFLIYPTLEGKHYPLQYRLRDVDLEKIINKPFVSNMLSVSPMRTKDKHLWLGKKACYIDPGGEVYPNINLRWPCGNLKSQSFSDIWNRSRILKSLNKLRWSDFECNSCNKFKRCICWDPFLAHLEHRNFKAVPREICRFVNAISKKRRAG